VTDIAVQTRGLTRRFGDLVAVNQLDLDIPAGTIFGFLGPNSSGKTTAIRMLCGLLTPSAGSARVLGLDIPRQAEILRTRFGYMTQKFSLYQELTVRENLEFIGQIYGLSRSRTRDRVAALSRTYNLGDLEERRLDAMSGGQRQRVALACALVHEPTLLFLDEPTSAVDPESRRSFWECLFDLSEAGTTILVSTHYMDEAERCHELAILETGTLRALGAPEELMADLGASVVELEGTGLRQVKTAVLALPQVRSVAQLGLRLRVQVDAAEPDPVGYLQRNLATPGLTAQRTHASLEDVFVNVTLGDPS